ncbi:Collagen alpha-1(VIII) chain [Collichthys lucidus]|uniref:Collagen alpha-1(VIII) chain n=1 Tax=Collichthys lucidus TaxID=240159 RepID=A0A4U5VQA8_COLLU|nr:Collagen alpha-1(VIII) chain [Collichthys lucidus]
MDRLFLWLLLVSGSMCTGSYSCLGTGTSLEACQPDTCTLLSEVAAMREKLAAMTQTQSKLEETLSAAMASVQSYKSEVEELRRVNKNPDEQLKALADVTSAALSKIAFTATLGSSVGPLAEDMSLKYQRILTNIGRGYNPATGIFTATARGVYYFRYTMYNNNAGHPNSVVSLMKNGERMMSSWDTSGGDANDSASNAAVLQLEVGDSVYVQLYKNRLVYDDAMYYNTFSGFLLYSL